MRLISKSRIKALIVGVVVAKIIITGYYLTGRFKPNPLSGGTYAVAVAQAQSEPEPKPAAQAEEEKANAGNAAESAPAQLLPEDIKAVMDTLEKKRIALQEEEARLKKERAEMDFMKREIEDKIEELTAVQKKIEDDLNKKSAMAEQAEKNKDMEEKKKVQQLVKVYSSMKPKSAAEIVDKMDIHIVLQVFSNMKGEQVGEIMTYVNKDRAAKISELLVTPQK